MKSLLFAMLIVLGFNASGAHILGGEVYYDTIGQDSNGFMQYQVTFEIYRDCSSFGALFDDPINYSVFHANGTLFAFTQVLPIPDTIPIVYDDPCVTPPNDVCIERAIYIDTIALPPSIAGFYVTYQRCCWATNILNIDTPGDWGITIIQQFLDQD
ncbi:hypothetical protein N9C33_03430 [Crocinitomicaceae bacterium]|nr:hypothetical protein [Crocinitomicaceae bacterium]